MNKELETEASERAAQRTPAEPQADAHSVVVDIYDQAYHLRGIDADYIEHLAHMVDTKMRAVAQHGKTVDSLRVAVLAALNIADELATLQARYDTLTGQLNQEHSSLKSRADSLTGLLDAILEEDRKVG